MPTSGVQIQSISGGFTQVVILSGDGSVWTMGCNTRGQLGIGTIGADNWSSVPVHVDLPGPAKQVGSGTAFCWALSADGRSIYAWGDNTAGQLGVGNSAVKRSTVPRQVDLNLPTGVTVVSMASGAATTLALLSNGHVIAWGDNQYGQCGLDPATAGQYIYKPTLIPGLTDVTSLASGDSYSMALKQNGTVWAWGENDYGQLGPSGPTNGKDPYTYTPVEVQGLPPIQELIAGGNNGVALDDSGNVWEWGRNEFGELGRGYLDQNDKPHPTPKMVAGLPTIASVASQGPTVLATDGAGNIYTWGFNKWGAVGNGQTADAAVPQLVLTLPTSPESSGQSVQVAAAHRSSYAFNTVTGETYAWGENNYGQIGIRANNSPNPVPVNISNEVLVAIDPPGILLQNTDGQLVVWQTNGAAITASGAIGQNIGPSWFAMARGPFFPGDTSDVLYQDANGSVELWQVQGTTVLGATVFSANPGPSWHIKGTGDFFNDGHTDILWQNNGGAVSIWDMSGASVIQSATVPQNPGPTWHVEGSGDFYNDGHTAIVLQNDGGSVELWDMNGATVIQSGAVANPGSTWRVKGTGDFYGDGHSDILLQNDSGPVAIWEMNGTTIVKSAQVANPGPTWHVQGTGDFNADGKTDIALQDESGAVAIWNMNGATIASSTQLANPGTSWNIVGSDPMRFIYSGSAGETLAATPTTPDEFVFTNAAAGMHTITGFATEQDIVELSGTQFANFAAVQAATTAASGGAMIALGHGASLLLSGVDPATLHASDFAIT